MTPRKKTFRESLPEPIQKVFGHAIASVIIIAVGVAWMGVKSYGQAMFSASVANTQAIKDVRKQASDASHKCDSTAVRVDTLQTKVDRVDRLERELFGAMLDANPEFKAAVKNRAAKSAQAAKKKKETDDLVNTIAR